MKVLLIDHYDSFVFNLARYFEQLGASVQVVRQDAISIDAVLAQAPDAIVLSPGPGGPDDTGISCELVRRCQGQIPLLGVCLGHQVIGHILGGRVERAQKPMHGRSSLIHHTQTGLFQGLPTPLTVGRYHSLIVNEAGFPDTVKVTARSMEGEVMAFESSALRLAGVQFHPESILTEGGLLLLKNFLWMNKG